MIWLESDHGVSEGFFCSLLVEATADKCIKPLIVNGAKPSIMAQTSTASLICQITALFVDGLKSISTGSIKKIH
jgi:hypothetical protein